MNTAAGNEVPKKPVYIEELMYHNLPELIGSLSSTQYHQVDIVIPKQKIEVPFIVSGYTESGSDEDVEAEFSEDYVKNASSKYAAKVHLIGYSGNRPVEMKVFYVDISEMFDEMPIEQLSELPIDKVVKVDVERYLSYHVDAEYFPRSDGSNVGVVDADDVPIDYCTVLQTLPITEKEIMEYLGYPSGEQPSVERHYYDTQNKEYFSVLHKTDTQGMFEYVETIIGAMAKGSTPQLIRIYAGEVLPKESANIDKLWNQILSVYKDALNEIYKFINEDSQRFSQLCVRTLKDFKPYTDNVYKKHRQTALELTIGSIKIPVKIVAIRVGGGKTTFIFMLTPFTLHVFDLNTVQVIRMFSLRTMSLVECQNAAQPFGLASYFEVCDLRKNRTLASLISG